MKCKFGISLLAHFAETPDLTLLGVPPHWLGLKFTGFPCAGPELRQQGPQPCRTMKHDAPAEALKCDSAV